MSDGTDDGAGTAAFDPEKFEHKYEHYFAELEQVYTRAFETMHAEYDASVVHAIDQQVLAESEPVYEGNGRFRIELPDEATERVDGAYGDPEEIEAVLGTYVDRLETELRREFGFA